MPAKSWAGFGFSKPIQVQRGIITLGCRLLQEGFQLWAPGGVRETLFPSQVVRMLPAMEQKPRKIHYFHALLLRESLQ
jgi:hypothetical protein